MAVESPSSPSLNLNKGSSSSPFLKMAASSSPPLFSPSSDKRYWSALHSRIDTLIENRTTHLDLSPSSKKKAEAIDGGASKRLKEDSILLLRGFDSVAQSLSQLSNNLENALQGARDLARPPTLTEIVQATLQKPQTEENNDQLEEEEEEEEGRGLKRKLESEECSEDGGEVSDKAKEKKKSPQEFDNMKKAKNLAITMATKASTLARELKSIRSDLSFMQERCGLLEEENRKLRDGLGKGIRPEEDDLVRLQLETLLAEKSRLANENANLKRENQCLNQLVEYHQLTSQDLSASYENLVNGMCLDFSSPLETADECCDMRNPETPRGDALGFCKSLDECYDEEQE